VNPQEKRILSQTFVDYYEAKTSQVMWLEVGSVVDICETFVLDGKWYRKARQDGVIVNVPIAIVNQMALLEAS